MNKKRKLTPAEATLRKLFGYGRQLPTLRSWLFHWKVQEQFNSIRIGKAAPSSSAPVSVWRSCSSEAMETIAEMLSMDTAQESLPENLTSSQIAWLPKPGKKPDKPEKLRPIGVIAPEGKILAGYVRKQIKPALSQSLQDKPQFGFVPNRGTGEATGQALTHTDEGRQQRNSTERLAGKKKFQGPSFQAASPSA